MSRDAIPSDDTLREAILAAVAERGAEKTVCPSEIARGFAGKDETRWRLLMSPIRRVAVGLAQAGAVEIRRKGRTIDPSELRGIYRIGLVRGGG